jgi:uncharacterized protein YjbI with pentapeptide repeats
MLYPSLSGADLSGVADTRTRIELQQAQAKLQNDARSALLQGFAGLLVVIGALATWRQVNISREGQITDRFAHAIDQLGSEKPEVRVGGIRALERIATNSKEDRAAIAYVLGAFVRVHASGPAGPRGTPASETPAVDEDLPWLQHRAPDVQTAMWVLGRRKPAAEPVLLYLSRVDLRSAHLAGANLSDAQLRHADLAHAWMPGADLDRCDLELADLRQANLQSARLRAANLQGANLQGARLEGADLTAARSDARTVWPDGFDADRLRDAGVLVVSPVGDGPPDPAGR